MAGIGFPIDEAGLDTRLPAHPVLEISEEKRSKRNPKQLDFEATMDEFRVMFPGLATELIESVLRSNKGSVDETIDQLLTMNTAKSVNNTTTDSNLSPPPRLPPKPTGSLRSSREKLAENESLSPAVPPREGSLKRNKTKQSQFNQILYTTPHTRYDTEWNGKIIPLLGKLPSNFLRLNMEEVAPPRPPKSLKNRSQSLRSQLPLHLAEQPSNKNSLMPTNKANTIGHFQKSRQGHITTNVGERLSSNVLRRQIEANQRRINQSILPTTGNHAEGSVSSSSNSSQATSPNPNSCTSSSNEIDSEAERFLEDERVCVAKTDLSQKLIEISKRLKEILTQHKIPYQIRLALIMQNEEFLRELKRNEDFMRTLEFERDMLATRLAHERKKNRHLVGSSPHSTLDRGASQRSWMSSRDIESLAPDPPDHVTKRLEPDTDQTMTGNGDTSVLDTGPVDSSLVPVERPDKNEVHDFRDQLKSMGATSKKQFAVLAKKFFSTSRRKRKVAGKMLKTTPGVSTLNLLEDNDDEDLIDISNAVDNEGDATIMFEPLPDGWTSSAVTEGNMTEDEPQSNETHFI